MFTLSSSQYVITFVSTLSYGRHFRNETTPYKQINFIPVSSTTSPSLPPSSSCLLAVLLFFFSPPHWQNFKQNSRNNNSTRTKSRGAHLQQLNH